MSTVEFVGDIDFSRVHFGPVERSDNKSHVDMFRNATDLSKRNKFHRVSVCRDAAAPMTAPYGLDKPHADSNSKRLGMFVKVEDPDVIASFQKLDEVIIKAATERSQEWFKRKLDEDAVRAKYKPICCKRDTDDFYHMKIKVKLDCETATVLHLRDDTCVRKNAGRTEHLQQPFTTVPHVSMSYGLWFMGSMFGLTVQAEEMIVCPSQSKADDLSHFVSTVPIAVATTPAVVCEEPTAKRAKEERGSSVVLQEDDDDGMPPPM